MSSFIERKKVAVHALLRKTEKYTKTDMVYFAKGSFWLTGGQVLSSVAVFLLAVAFARFIPKETYGTYKYILSIVGILTVTTLRGMDGALTQAVAQANEGTLLPALKAKIRWGMLGAIGSIFFALYNYFMGNEVLTISFLVVAVFLPFMDSLGIYNAFLQGKKQFKTSATYTTASQILAAIILIATVAITKNLYIILFAYFASWTFLKLFFFTHAIKKFPPNQKADPSTLSYGKHSSVVSITATVISSFDSIIMFHYLGSIELAVYAFALAPVVQLRGLFNQIPILAIPKLAQRPAREIRQILWKRFFALFAAGSVIAASYIIAAPYLFSVFFPRYLESVALSQVFSLSIPIALANTILGAAISSKLTSTPKKLLYLWNIPNIIFVIFVLIFIQPFGTMGVVVSRLVSLLSGVLIALYIWRMIEKKEEKQEEIVATKI
ncbi:MAG: oligosaccharide flippase family protein [Candidatus Azambacteria bacterium]|nr:oligosaccharide flippase family protein [Candidatus Azambacteria bacterium]